MVNVAILGYGTVGSGVYKIIKDNFTHVSRRAGEDINIKYVLDLRDFPGDPVEEVLTHDVNDILNDDSVEVVVEVMGGVEPAFTFVKKALEAANKLLKEANDAKKALLKMSETVVKVPDNSPDKPQKSKEGE